MRDRPTIACFIFSIARDCSANATRDSWVILRSQEKEELKVIENPPANCKLTHDQEKWCEDEDDWGIPSSEDKLKCVNDSEGKKEGSCNLFGQELTLSSLSLDTSDTIATGIADNQMQMSCIPSYYIQVIEEPIEFCDHKELARKVIDSVSGSSSETYEKTTAKHGDKTFYKFHKRLGRCPEQVLRYQWNGTPLLITDKTLPAPLACQHCGASRVFELQLMPPLVYLLKASSKVNVEFGTVLVYTCSKSCWHVGSVPREEYIYIQSEPEDTRLTKLSF